MEPVTPGHHRRRLVAAAVMLLAGPAAAQLGDGPVDPTLTVKQKQALRFPQPVRVGDLHDEYVIKAGSDLQKLGRVVGVVRSGGDLHVVFTYGAVLGFGGRPIALDLDEVALVGPLVKVIDLDRDDLKARPTFDASKGAFLAPDAIIRLGVARKY